MWKLRLCQTKSKSEAGGESKSESRPKWIPATSKYRAVQAAISQVNSSEVDEYDIESEEVETGTRQEWSEEDAKNIQENLEKEKTCPKKMAIKWFFNKNDNLKDILRRNGLKRCQDKLKNEWKKSKKK